MNFKKMTKLLLVTLMLPLGLLGMLLILGNWVCDSKAANIEALLAENNQRLLFDKSMQNDAESSLAVLKDASEEIISLRTDYEGNSEKLRSKRLEIQKSLLAFRTEFKVEEADSLSGLTAAIVRTQNKLHKNLPDVIDLVIVRMQEQEKLLNQKLTLDGTDLPFQLHHALYGWSKLYPLRCL
jgi:hypothetical protein